MTAGSSSPAASGSRACSGSGDPMRVPPEVVEFIRAHRRFIILGHKEPDGDCIASQIVMRRILLTLGKTGRLASAGPFDRPEIEQFEREFSKETGSTGGEAEDAAVILDCSTPDRTGNPDAGAAGLPTLVVDHHSSGEVFGDARFVVTSAPSTTVLVLALADELGYPVSLDDSRLLLFGLCTDTGFFRHLGPGSGDTYRTVARLTEYGTSTAEIFRMAYGGRDLNSRKLLAAMLHRAESLWDGKLLLTWQTADDRKATHGFQRGEDDLYRLLQTVKGNEVVAFIKEEDGGRFSLGLRSNKDVDVGRLAASFGGGGHRQAAGCDMKGPIESIKQKLIEALTPILGM
jgi:phosphoesterase RecJ-like protein